MADGITLLLDWRNSHELAAMQIAFSIP